MSDRPYRLPAGWAPQAGVLMCWPRSAAEEPVHVRVVAAVARREDVVIACGEAAMAGRVRALLGAAGVELARVRLHVVAGAEGQARQRGPITVVRDGHPLLLGFGGDGRRDGSLTRRLHALGAFGAAPLASFELSLAGDVETDGEGTLLTARGERPREAELRALFGLERVLQLDRVGDGDHVPARFVDRATIAYQSCENPEDPSFPALLGLAGELTALRTAAGERYRLVALPWPRDRVARASAGYASFLIVNGAVLVPTRASGADARALALLTAGFPDREVIGIECPIDLRDGLYGLAMPLPLPLALGPSTA